jgi:hypothetical protein
MDSLQHIQSMQFNERYFQENSAPFEYIFNEKLGEVQENEVLEMKVEVSKSPQKYPKVIKRSSVPSGSPIAKKMVNFN